MRSLPLFHRIAGQPVIVLGNGPEAEAKRRLVERAGGKVVTDLALGVERGARLAFIGHADRAACEADASRLQSAGLLVNVVDRPELCDFTTPSILDRDPVLVAVGTAGTSAGLAKHLRLRLETLLPPDLGRFAEALHSARDALRRRWPGAADRRRALDAALEPGGALDPLVPGAAERLAGWLDDAAESQGEGRVELTLASDDPDDLTLRQARLLGTADVILHEPAVPAAILDRARADAVRWPLGEGEPAAEHGGVVVILRRL